MLVAFCIHSVTEQQLLDMLVPVAHKSKHKAGKAAKDGLELGKSFSHVVTKVKKKEVKQVPA